jgi:hypothetical protein
MKALYLLLFVSGTALANDAAILKCRAIGEPGARLGCYDAIPASANAAPAAAARGEQDFGLEMKKKAEEPKSVESTIVGRFDGWAPTSQVKLANGQVWRVIDGSSAVLAPLDNPKVRIVRNLFGTTFMEVEGTNNSPKVRRVQ